MNINQRHRRRVSGTLLLTMGIVCLTGCIRDDLGPCPDLTTVFSVKDRVYANAAAQGYEDPAGELTDFGQIIPNLCYTLRDAESGAIVREGVINTSTTAGGDYNLQFDSNLPFGRYVLTAWGNVPDRAALDSQGILYDLSGLDHNLYMVNDTIEYSFDKSLIYGELQRVNGLVTVETLWDTFPEGIDRSHKTFTTLYDLVDNELTYSGNQNISVDYSFATAMQVTSRTVLPPSVYPNGTKLSIRYFNSEHPDEPGIIPQDVNLTVRRNEVTRLQYSFDPYAKTVIIKTMVNGQWMCINDMGVD